MVHHPAVMLKRVDELGDYKDFENETEEEKILRQLMFWVPVAVILVGLIVLLFVVLFGNMLTGIEGESAITSLFNLPNFDTNGN